MLADQLFELPVHLRGEKLLAAASFGSRSSVGPELELSSIRASLAQYWENRFSVAIPFREIRELLHPPIPVSQILRFCCLNYCETKSDLKTELADNADDLSREMLKAQSPKQAYLFSTGAGHLEKYINSSPFCGKSVADLNQLEKSECKFQAIYADSP